MDIVDELNGSQEPTEEVVTETPVAEAPAAEVQEEAPELEATAERPRGPDGKFAKKDVMVPLAALHETRDELKTLKAEIEQLRQPKPAETPKAPDIFEDPEGFTGHIQRQIEQATLNTTLNISEEMTRASVGPELVEAAQQWGLQQFDTNPTLRQQFVTQRNPYGFLVQQYQRATAIQQIGDDPAAIQDFIKWREAQSAPQPAPQPAVPTSLADQQSARGSTVPYQPPSLEELLKG